MNKHMHNYLALMVVPFLLFVASPAVQAGSVQQDVFLENTYEDYTLATGNFWADNRQQSEFAAMETSKQVSDADLFLENTYEDYTLGQ